MVDSFTHLKQRLEYFRTLAQVIEAENALRNFAKMIVTVTLKIPYPIHILKDDQRYPNNQQEMCLAK